jgi:hypothetical protein
MNFRGKTLAEEKQMKKSKVPERPRGFVVPTPSATQTKQACGGKKRKR